MKSVLSILLLIASFLGIGIDQSYAQEIIQFGPRDARIEGSIPYTVLGHYKASFRVFKGRIVLDKESGQLESVYLEIEVKSLISSSVWCDRAARSRRLLNAARFPKIIFKSNKIIHDDEGFKVEGILQLHGIKRAMIFPFSVKRLNHGLVIQGAWNIDRRDFNIIWNKYLDHGGILVGNIFTVNWRIKA